MNSNKSDLAVIVKAKDLCGYIMTVTQKPPKVFRFTFVAKLQNLSLEVLEYLYRANDVFVAKGDLKSREKRLELQREAMTSLKLLMYISELAYEQKCILFNQYEQISLLGTECLNMLGAWMNSDRKRWEA